MELKYTSQEINSNVSKLEDKMELLKRERTVITKNINSIKKQIEYWKSLSVDQLKIPYDDNR